MLHLPPLKHLMFAATLALLAVAPVQAKEKFKVITTFTVIADMAQNVAGDAADVSSITKPGAEIHEYQPTPGDIKRAQGAQLILANGLNLELWFARFYQHLNGVPEVVVSNGIQPMGISEGPYNGKPNPHAWMSADNALIYVDNIRDALVKYDPANADAYRHNAEAYKEKIRQTMAPLKAELAKLPQDKRWLVTSEGAFSYLARDNGLQERYLWPINADQQGTPQQVRKTIDTMKKERIPTIFSESTISDKPARQVARRRPVRRLSERRRWPGADLSRPAARYHPNHRPGHQRRTKETGMSHELPGLAVNNVSVTYRNGHTALRDASFSVPRSAIAALVGVNGSGKSTLFKALMGFVRVGKGDIAILGQPVNRALRQNLVAYVPQAEEVDWSFPVLVEDVVMMGRYGHMGWLRRAKPRDHEIVDAALARVGMSEYRHRQIGELSGGQKKRVFLARAIAQQGKVILLDEPFTGVDVQTEARIIELLRELRDEGCTMLVSTHNLGSVSEFCDYTVMVKGTVLASGPTESTFTAENLELAFSGVLRHVVLSGAEERIITDDERPFISRRAAGGER